MIASALASRRDLLLSPLFSWLFTHVSCLGAFVPFPGSAFALFLLDVSYVPSCFAGLSSAGTSPLVRVGTVFFGWFSAVSNS